MERRKKEDSTLSLKKQKVLGGTADMRKHITPTIT